jgi:hypothetical protein
MPVEWSDESFYKKEMARWDRKKSQGGMNADGFERFPQMLYKAQLQPLSNKYEVCLPRDIISADKTVVILSAEQFNASCQLIVNDEREYERARAEGWRDSQNEAMAYHEALQQDIARAAAERNYADRNMSEKAKAEAQKVEDSTAAQVPVIPEKPGLSPEAKQKLRDNLARARAAKVAKKAAQSVSG